MKKHGLKSLFYAFAIITIIAIQGCNNHNDLKTIEQYWAQWKVLERNIIENVPIYEDFATPAEEAELRQFLLADHLAMASQKPMISSQEQALELQNTGDLIRLDPDDAAWFFYNVPKENRLGYSELLSTLHLIAQQVSTELKQHNISANVKFAVSSALRPTSYQAKLRNRNENAALVSSHSHGVSVDIFYDEFFISLEPPSAQDDLALHLNTMRTRAGFIYAAALRRQLKTVVTKALLQLQRDKKIIVILERNQRCFHVTPVL